ncbi:MULTISPECIES: MarC family protein [Pacificibacter]|uniref:MarC family protein n=1 Tax=Pacificibacter TaxID=1042323 RepID=UPI001C09D7AA|nr:MULTISPECIES: MarC family protein [Pacificibacter]MBU2936925.1 MarC family protein [Pacificibacter marinus]MDO6614919.1 MarC family protein [Pacificibacter sp. 1_MG-2023]
MDLNFLLTAFVTLFVIIDPIGLMPIFVSLTAGSNRQARRTIAVRAILVGFGVLILFGFFGEAVLGFAGISMPAFRMAGGILLFLTALDMLFERRTKRREDQANQPDISEDDPSVFPLATPLIAGPGAIASMILLTGQTETTLAFASVFGVLAVVLLIAFALFIMGGLLERALGPTGVNVITRILGMLLAALSVQFILDGLREVGALPY